MSSGGCYDHIGRGYVAGRRPDPRLALAISNALGSATPVVNVGAGTGNYEPSDRSVVAVEPSALMISQRPIGSAPAVQGVAEHLPTPSRSFAASMALSTIHHWSDLRAGLLELARVAPRRLVYFSEPAQSGRYWLVDEYFPSIVSMPTNRAAPTTAQVAELIGGPVEVRVFEVPTDFMEGSAGAFWNRPERYCDPSAQAAMSMFALLDPEVVEAGTRRLRADLRSGAWDARHGHLRTQESIDLGYRIVISTEP